MNTPLKRKGKSYWSRVEDAGEAMELGARFSLGCFFAFPLSGLAWWIGSDFGVGVAMIITLIAFPLGFLVGFFWLEVKFVLRLILGFLTE